ncbi:MAG: DUF2442 domain-containing protein [Chloroflexi bacterium]|nr:DUF2442 domain-containing protein [Chloroflexota bacterium]
MALPGLLRRVKKVQILEDFWILLEFDNEVEKKVNLEPFLHGPIFEPIRQHKAVFRQIHVENGTITWPNGADIDPDVLYYGLKPAWMEVQELEEATP